MPGRLRLPGDVAGTPAGRGGPATRAGPRSRRPARARSQRAPVPDLLSGRNLCRAIPSPRNFTRWTDDDVAEAAAAIAATRASTRGSSTSTTRHGPPGPIWPASPGGPRGSQAGGVRPSNATPPCPPADRGIRHGPAGRCSRSWLNGWGASSGKRAKRRRPSGGDARHADRAVIGQLCGVWRTGEIDGKSIANLR